MTAKRRASLLDRVDARIYRKPSSATFCEQVRAELDRLARAVRRLKGLPYGLISVEDYVKRSDVIEAIKAAKR